MVAEPKVVHVAPDSEIARLLDAANGQPLVIETGRARFRLVREEDDDAAQNGSEEDRIGKFDAAWEATIGSWGDVDADEMIEFLYRAREEGSRHNIKP